ncbi:MAG: hypothetical protein KY468_16350 [Armatimonadetes bacterium]|nr:hypothetical protein [Armatimonadota bacterium]
MNNAVDPRKRWMIASAVAGVLASAPMIVPEPPSALAAPARPAARPAPKPTAQPRARLTSLPRAKPPSNVTMDFRDAPIDQILNFFSVVSGLTVIKDPGLQGNATLITPRPVPLNDAISILEALLDSRGFRLERTATMLRILPKGGGGGGRPGGGRGERGPGGSEDGGGFAGLGGGRRNAEQTQVFQLQYARAQGVATIVNDLFRNNAANRAGRPGGPNNNNNTAAAAAVQPVGARASADEYSNSVVVMGPTPQIELIGSIIEQIDKPVGTNQVTQVFPIKNVLAQEMAGVIGNVLIANAQQGAANTPATLEQRANNNNNRGRRWGQNAAAANGQVVAHTQTNSVVVTASEEQLDLVQAVVEELDKPQEVQGTTFVRNLRNASAAEVAQMLNQIYQRRGIGGNFGNRGFRNTGTGFGQGGFGAGGFGNNRQNNNRGNNNFNNRNNRNTGGGTQRRGIQQRRGSADGVEGNGTGVPGSGPVRIASATPFVPPAEQPDTASATVDTAGTLNTQNMLAQGPGGFPFGGGGFPGGFPGGGFGGFQGGFQGGGAAGTGNLQAVPDVNTNSIIFNADPATMAALDQVLASLDRAPEQVLIEAVIVEANLDDSSRLGFQFQWTQPNLGRNTTGAGEVGVTPSTAFSPAGLRYSIVGNNFSAILQALATDRRFNILSTPRIFTANNRPAQINISQQIPYIESTIVNPTGTTQNAINYLDVGIILDVTPRITGNGLVTIEVSQDANDFQGFTNFNAPIVSRRTTDTTVVVQDGQTVIIGGLIRDSTTKTTNKVPILGDIPLIGGLFRSKENVRQKTELMVFLTPHVVRTADEISDLTERQRNQLQLAPPVTLSRPKPTPPIETQPGAPLLPIPPARGGDLPGTEGPNATDGGDDTPEAPAPAPDSPGGEGGGALPPPVIDGQ